jgi:small GTP-binding protein
MKNEKNEVDLDFEYEILPDDNSDFDLSFKLIIIGDSGVGKSCLTNSAIKNSFEENYNATIGFEFITFNIKINERIIKLQIWDTCGQELYRSLITNFYRNSSLAIMVYAINNKESFDDIDMWLRELRTYSNPNAKIFLIGNKLDLENERKIPREKGEKFSKDNNFDLFLESSAKAGINTRNLFIKAAKILHDEFIQYEKENSDNEDTLEKDQSFKFEDKYDSNSRNKVNDKSKKKKKRRCC